MRPLFTAGAAGAMVLVVATSCFAGAYRLSPSTPFAGSGTMTVTAPSNGSLNCTVVASGNGQSRQVTSLTFSGGTGCSEIQAANLPWKIRLQSTHSLHISGVALVSPNFGQCGPNEAFAKLNNGVLQIKDLLPSRGNGQVCRIEGTMTTVPALTITKQ